MLPRPNKKAAPGERPGFRSIGPRGPTEVLAVRLPYAGMNRFRFEGYALSLRVQAPPATAAHHTTLAGLYKAPGTGAVA